MKKRVRTHNVEQEERLAWDRYFLAVINEYSQIEGAARVADRMLAERRKRFGDEGQVEKEAK